MRRCSEHFFSDHYFCENCTAHRTYNAEASERQREYWKTLPEAGPITRWFYKLVGATVLVLIMAAVVCHYAPIPFLASAILVVAVPLGLRYAWLAWDWGTLDALCEMWRQIAFGTCIVIGIVALKWSWYKWDLDYMGPPRAYTTATQKTHRQ
jgi:hypothetical protein